MMLKNNANTNRTALRNRLINNIKKEFISSSQNQQQRKRQRHHQRDYNNDGSIFIRFIYWLSQEGPYHIKHKYDYRDDNKKRNNNNIIIRYLSILTIHPIIVCMIHYIVVYCITIQSHDYLIQIHYNWLSSSDNDDISSTISSTSSCYNNNMQEHLQQQHIVQIKNNNNYIKCLYIAIFLVTYAIWLLLWRIFCLKTTTTTSPSSPKTITKTTNKNFMSNDNVNELNNNENNNINNNNNKENVNSNDNQNSNNDFTGTTLTSALLYEYCWLCNVTLIMGAIGIITNRPIILWSLCITIGIDQLLWYIDIIVAIISRGKVFPIGVAKYLIWDYNTSWYSRITCTHHLWTIPLLLYTTSIMSNNVIYYEDTIIRTIESNINISNSTLSLLSEQPTCTYIDNNTRLQSEWIIPLLSFIIMTTNVLLSRWMIPSHIAIKKNYTSNNATSKTNDGNTKNEYNNTVSSSSSHDDNSNYSHNVIETTNHDEHDDTETKSTSSSLSSFRFSASSTTSTPPNMCGIITNQSLMMSDKSSIYSSSQHNTSTNATKHDNNSNGNGTKQQQINSNDINGDEYIMRYLNVNLSYELWKDIQFSFLQINYDNPNVILYIFRLLWRWQLFNMIVFIILRYVYTSIIV